MRTKKFNKLKNDVLSTEEYTKDIQLIEQFLSEKELDTDKTTILFWNHMVSLLKRIDTNQQHTTDKHLPPETNKEVIGITRSFIFFMASKRKFNITPTETYLLSVYFKQLV